MQWFQSETLLLRLLSWHWSLRRLGHLRLDQQATIPLRRSPCASVLTSAQPAPRHLSRFGALPAQIWAEFEVDCAWIAACRRRTLVRFFAMKTFAAILALAATVLPAATAKWTTIASDVGTAATVSARSLLSSLSALPPFSMTVAALALRFARLCRGSGSPALPPALSQRTRTATVRLQALCALVVEKAKRRADPAPFVELAPHPRPCLVSAL